MGLDFTSSQNIDTSCHKIVSESAEALSPSSVSTDCEGDNAGYRVDTRWEALSNFLCIRIEIQTRLAERIRIIEHGLESTQTVPYLTMLKALIMRKRNWEDLDEQHPALERSELEAYGKVQLQQLLEASVRYCNDNTQSEKFKTELKKA